MGLTAFFAATIAAFTQFLALGNSLLIKLFEDVRTAMLYEEIENYITRCMQSGVRHYIRSRSIGLYQWDTIKPLFQQADKFRRSKCKALINGVILKEDCVTCYFNSSKLPVLKNDNYNVKEYTRIIQGVAINATKEQKFKCEVKTLSFKYNFASHELEMNMTFDVQKFEEIGEKSFWSSCL